VNEPEWARRRREETAAKRQTRWGIAVFIAVVVPIVLIIGLIVLASGLRPV
jgi:hypothetical protein